MPLTKKAERTKAKLTASARKLISERGFDNVSVEEITKDAGVAKGTFYHYFVCKEDVIREFSTRVIEEIFTTAMTMPGGPQEKLTYYFNAILHEADRMGINLIRQWIRDIMSPRSAEEGAENLREGYRKIYTILKHTKEENQLKEDTPVAFLTKLLLSHLYGALITWCMLGGSFKLSEESNQFVTEEINAFLYKYMKQ